jgi:hypoxanthine phosphoribosyltransferase
VQSWNLSAVDGSIDNPRVPKRRARDLTGSVLASAKLGEVASRGNVLIVDEVDDTRTTLQFAVEELLHKCQPKRVGVCVVHNKIKPKKGILPEGVAYFAAENVQRAHCVTV